MKKRSLKQRIVAATLALVMLLSSLLGTTFAWFTDSVTSGGNKIQSGNLEVDLLHKVKSDWVSLKEHTDHKIFDYDKWEPGYTRVESLKVANLGSLALKYKLSLEAAVGTAVLGKNGEKLSDVIDVYVSYSDSNAASFDIIKSAWVHKGTLTQVLRNPASFIEGELLPAGEDSSTVDVGSKVVSIALHMQEDAGNEYQKLSVGDIYVNLIATQSSYENDSFGDKYDEDATFPELNIGGLNIPVNTENGKTTNGTTAGGKGVSATIPAGVAVEDGVDKLVLSVSEKEKSDANLTLEADEVLRPLDVHMEGVADDNTKPILIKIGKAMAVGLNIGNYTLYHVEDGVSNKMTAVGSLSDLDAHNEYYYDPATGDVTLAMATFSEVALVAEQPKWEGNRDYSWYDASKTELTIANSDQLAGLSAIVGGMDGQTQDSFYGKTIKLIADINIGDTDSENGYVFYPIGYWNSEETYEKNTAEATTALSSGFYAFQGTFDGNGHTIANFYQNTWEMKGDHNWYDPIKEQYYRDGMGLFGKVYGGSVKNLTVKNFSSDGEITTTGTIAAYADCGATFENIAIFNCNPRVYNIGNGGIVGCVGWYANDAHTTPVTFKNITVDNTNKISALWGSWDVACGGIVGQYYPTSGQESAIDNGGIYMENCHVAAQIDVYNDVCANYQYYAYRYAGILIGSVRENVTVDGHVYPNMDGITAKNCTVHYGDWNDYYYCELVANSLASYTHDHQMSRLTQVASVDVANKTVTDLEGNTTAIPTSGRVNYVVVKAQDANGKWIHGDGHDYAECYHFVNGVQHLHDVADADNPTPTETVNGVEVLKEDKQLIYREFNNLVTGYGWGVTSKGVGDMGGVTILDREEGVSVEKFVGKVASIIETNTVYKLGDLFYPVSSGVELKLDQLMVSISDVDSTDGTVTGTYTPSTTGNWEDATISLTGTGVITITIQDYYFCTPTTITLMAYRKIDSLSCTLNEDSSLDKVYAHIGDKKVEVPESKYTMEERYGAYIVRVNAIYCGDSLYYDTSYPLLETIACSNHVVMSMITKQPTLTEDGVMTHTCAGCGYKETETIGKWTPDSIDDQTKQCKDYLFKDYVLNGATKVEYAVSDPTITAIEYIDVSDGTQDLTLTGWLGGINSEIKAFGYYLGNNYYNTIFSDGYTIGTTSDIVGMGGNLAERYIITADLRTFWEDDSKDTEKITYVALLADNTLVTIWDVYVCKGDALVDGEVKASADEMPYYIGGAAPNTSGSYDYITTTNVNFNVSGASAFDASTGGFSGSSITFTIDPMATQDSFNKYKIAYSSTQPMKATVTYMLNGTSHDDVVYLESGEHLFSCLAPGYLSGATIKNISAIKVESIPTGVAAEFILYHVTGESIKVYDATYEFQNENSNYVLGIALDKGGAMSSLVDLNDGIGGLDNLLNSYDAGRLVQQSYYGYFYNDPNILMNEAMWSYNPVQGGNIEAKDDPTKGTMGRLIDIEVKNNSVYIKAQPADWAVKGTEAWTPCYMENVYSIYGGDDARVEVYNSFIDFSNLDHTVKSQELPAFYTVSYLGSFMYYDMSYNKIVDHNLADWAGNPKAYFGVNSDKSWCAWYNNNDNYGVGLYAPNTDVLYAGRYNYNGSTDPADDATNYVAPLTDFKLELDKKFEYSYMITTGTVEKIDATFEKFKDFDENEMLDGANAVYGANVDAYYVNGNMVPAGGVSCDITLGNLKQGDTLAMSGWIGFRNVKISHFGYYVNGDISNIVPVAAMNAEEGVQAMGGPYAKRYNITVNTAGTPADTYKLTYVVVLENNEIETLAEWTVTIVEEDEVKPTANVIILAGQSNAYGASPITSAMKNAYGTPGAFPNVQIHYNNINEQDGVWQTLFSNAGFEPYYVGMGGQGTTHFGPEFGIAQWLAENRLNEQWFIIKYTAAGTILNGQWLEGDTNKLDPNGLKSEMNGYLADHMVNYVQNAIDSLSESHDVKVHSFMWMQGESDSLNQGLAESYQKQEQLLVEKVRDAFAGYTDSIKGESISFINGAIAAYKSQYSDYGNNWVYSDTVNQGKILNATQWYIPEKTTSNVLYSIVSNGNVAYLEAGFYPSTLNGAIANSMWIDTSNLLSKYEAGSENGEADAAHYCSASMQKLGAWFVTSMNMYIKSYTGPNSCDHSAGTEFNTTGIIVCSRCKWPMLVPNTNVVGEALNTQRDNTTGGWTTATNYVYDANGGYVRVTGLSATPNDPSSDVAYGIFTNAKRYLVIRFRTSEAGVNLRVITTNTGWVTDNTYVTTCTVANQWQVIVIDTGALNEAALVQLRCNVGAKSANAYTDISHVVSFDSIENANIYANQLGLIVDGACPHHGYRTEVVTPATCVTEGVLIHICDFCGFTVEGVDPVDSTAHVWDTNTAGVVKCTECGTSATLATLQVGDDLYNAIDSSCVDKDLISNSTDGTGVIVSGTSTHDYGGIYSAIPAAQLKLSSGTEYGKYMVVIYKLDTGKGYLGTSSNNSSIASYISVDGVSNWTICNYGATNTSGKTLEIICNFAGESSTTSIYGIATFNTAEEAAFYCEYLNYAKILDTLNGAA